MVRPSLWPPDRRWTARPEVRDQKSEARTAFRFVPWCVIAVLVVSGVFCVALAGFAAARDGGSQESDFWLLFSDF